MSKTIEEAAKKYSCDSPVTWENFCPGDIADAFKDGAEYVMSLPLDQRLTAEEKERVKGIYKELKRLYAKFIDTFTWAGIYRTQYELLESIFGTDFFKEEE